jgi:hypothetical protein
MVDTFIVAVEKNRMKQTALKFVLKNFKESDIAEVKNVWWKETGETDDNGFKTYTPVFNPSPEQLLKEDLKKTLDMAKERGVWIQTDSKGNPFFDTNLRVIDDGKVVVIEWKDVNIARAFNQQGVDQVPRALSLINRHLAYLRHVITQYSPEFMVRNAFRDSITGFINMAIDFDTVTATKIINPINGAKAWNALRQYYRNGKADGEWGEAFHEFMDEGGISGWWQLDAINKRYNRLRKGMEENGAWHKTKEAGKWVLETLDDYNRAAENMMRLVAYKKLGDLGIVNPKTGKPFTKKERALYAKNLTVNFNRKGELGSSLGALYMFFNASAQGIGRQLMPLTAEERGGNSRRQRRALIAPMVGASVGLAMIEMIRQAMGQDDDDEFFYDKIDTYTRHHNFIIPNLLSDKKGDYFKIPMPYGYNNYWALGDGISRLSHNVSEPAEVIVEQMGAFFDSYNPIGSGSGDNAWDALTKTIAPTVMTPFVEISMNQDFAGRPIVPEDFPGEPESPNAYKNFKYTSEVYKMIAQGMNSLTGGDQVRGGLVDVSPEHLEYAVRYFGGGAGSFVSGSVVTGYNVLSGEKWQEGHLYDVPYARTLYRQHRDSRDRTLFYERGTDINNLYADYEEYMDIDPDKAERFYQSYKDKIALYDVWKNYMSSIRRIRKDVAQARADGNNEEMKALEEQIDGIITEFNRQYHTNVIKPRSLTDYLKNRF